MKKYIIRCNCYQWNCKPLEHHEKGENIIIWDGNEHNKICLFETKKTSKEVIKELFDDNKHGLMEIQTIFVSKKALNEWIKETKRKNNIVETDEYDDDSCNSECQTFPESIIDLPN